MKTPIGGGATTVLASGQNIPLDVKVDATNVYWVNQGSVTTPNGMVEMKVPLAGGAPTMLATGQNTIFDLVVDSTTVYWNDWGQHEPSTMTNGSLVSVPIGGGTPTTIAAQVQAYDVTQSTARSLYATVNFAPPLARHDREDHTKVTSSAHSAARRDLLNEIFDVAIEGANGGQRHCAEEALWSATLPETFNRGRWDARSTTSASQSRKRRSVGRVSDLRAEPDRDAQ